jgi:hypothetical protein
MSLNAIFNCAYCVIFLFYPINSCVDTLTYGYFCSSIRTLVVTQLYKIVFVAYFGESIKMCANIFYILMNVNRYMLIGREHNPTLEKISNLDMNCVIGFSIAISLFLNIGHIFQYTLNDLNNTIYNYMSYTTIYIYYSYPVYNPSQLLTTATDYIQLRRIIIVNNCDGLLLTTALFGM